MSFHRRTHAPAFDERDQVPIIPPPEEAEGRHREV
jgi:hypothetical protein